MMVARRMILSLALLFALASAAAQSLAELLPAETFLALGAQDLAAQEAKLQPFIDEFERLELGQALENLMGGETEGEADADLEALRERFEGLTLLDVVGQEAWIAVSASSFNPLPAVTLLARVSPEASARVAELIAEASSGADVEQLMEGETPFFQQTMASEDESGQTLAYAQVGDLLALSSNPDTLRGVLRQLNGADEPNFVSSGGYAQTIGALDAGNLYGYLDYAQVARVLEPFAGGFGFEQLVARLSAALQTAGVQSGVMRLTDAGYETQSLQVPNADGGDAELYALLTTGTPADASALALAPETALSWQTSSFDLRGWWAYLNGLAASSPELGGDLDMLVQSFLGVDLQSALFAWAGGQVTTITTGTGEVVEPGMPSANLLGDTVFVLAATDEAAAQSGLSSLFQALSSQVAAFTDPTGGAGELQAASREVAGVTVQSYTVGEGISLNTAVANGRAYVGTSAAAMDAVLGAEVSGAPEVFAALAQEAPAEAVGIGVANDQATLRSSAQQIVSQLGLTSGLGGASTLDFDAVEAASAKLQTFLEFVAERLGYSLSYQTKGDGAIRGLSRAEVNW